MDRISKALYELRNYRSVLTKQEIKTLGGQIKNGNIEAAFQGLQTTIKKRGVEDGQTAQKNRSKAV